MDVTGKDVVSTNIDNTGGGIIMPRFQEMSWFFGGRVNPVFF